MGPAARIQAQVNRELIDLSKKSEAAAATPITPSADEKEDDDRDEEYNRSPEEVIVADVDEDESDEAEATEDVEEGEGGEDEGGEGSDEGGQVSDDDGEEEGAEEYIGEEDEPEELPTKSAKRVKKREAAPKKKLPPKKIGRGVKANEAETDVPIAGNSMKSAKIGIPARKRKVVEFAPLPTVEKKRGGKSGKKTA